MTAGAGADSSQATLVINPAAGYDCFLSGEPVPKEIVWTLWCKGRYQRQTHRWSGWAPLHPD